MVQLCLVTGFALCAASSAMADDSKDGISALNPPQIIHPVASKSAVTSQAPVDELDESDELVSRQIVDIRPSINYAWGDVDPTTLPEDFSVNTDDDPFNRSIETPLLLQWQPSNLWYHPLYFEDAPLERYGHTYSPLICQTVASTGRFVGQAVMLPYNATLRCPESREYPLGWYRPGECAPHLKYCCPWNEEAAVHEALAVVGLVFLIP